jgi:hypothetical protein
MKNENLIKICVILITICLLFNTLMGVYYTFKNKIRNHNEREMICKTGDLVYIKSLQRNKEIVTCCELTEEHGVKHITYCEDILIK